MKNSRRVIHLPANASTQRDVLDLIREAMTESSPKLCGEIIIDAIAGGVHSEDDSFIRDSYGNCEIEITLRASIPVTHILGRAVGFHWQSGDPERKPTGRFNTPNKAKRAAERRRARKKAQPKKKRRAK